jgi:hypothetical protein
MRAFRISLSSKLIVNLASDDLAGQRDRSTPKTAPLSKFPAKFMLTKNKQLSVNKMAEYLDARPARRASIVRQQKSGNGHPAQYYTLAQAAMRRILISEDPSRTYESELTLISSHEGWGNHPRQLVANNVEALKGMWTTVSQNGFMSPELIYRKPIQPFTPRIYGDVLLTSRFDVETIIAARKPKYAGIKFYLNKAHPLSDFSGAVLAAMLHESSIELLGKNSVSRKDIIIIDAFQGSVFHAPSLMKQHVAEAAAAAKEFSFHWDNIDQH